MKTLALALLVLAAGCASAEESYCENVGDCTHHGDSTWIQSCDDDATKLASDAAAAGCVAELDAYYACANASFTCTGATSSFPGCDDDLAKLDQCLDAAQSSTACAELAAATVACGGSPPGPTVCDAAADCQARCYLDTVTNPCAPRADELVAVTACGGACPP
jgi:hypothetical protein